jgi:hypothetical protein
MATDPLWTLIADMGTMTTASDLEEIRHMHQDVQLMDFETWLFQEFEIEKECADKISAFICLENKLKEGGKNGK